MVRVLSKSVAVLNNLNLLNLFICDIVGPNLYEKFNSSISLSRIIPQSFLSIGAYSLEQFIM